MRKQTNTYKLSPYIHTHARKKNSQAPYTFGLTSFQAWGKQTRKRNENVCCIGKGTQHWRLSQGSDKAWYQQGFTACICLQVPDSCALSFKSLSAQLAVANCIALSATSTEVTCDARDLFDMHIQIKTHVTLWWFVCLHHLLRSRAMLVTCVACT